MNDRPTPSRDVRMRGFTSRVRVEVAWEWIDQSAKRLENEVVRVAETHGRVLTSDVVARIDVPSFPRSAMDGYVEPMAISGASILSSTAQADGFLIVPEELKGYGPGTHVTVYLYDPT
ncbi:MAG: hypothetical protein HZA46_02950 [Planctomycetales bacterium]|nr:hypothetical protein [Planctomycetales bacterium]